MNANQDKCPKQNPTPTPNLFKLQKITQIKNLERSQGGWGLETPYLHRNKDKNYI